MKKAGAKPMFQSNSPYVLSLSGSALQALRIACDKFLVSGKDLRDFTITISQATEESESDAQHMFVVTFMGNLAPGRRGLGTANRVPGSLTYFITRKEWKIIKEQGIK